MATTVTIGGSGTLFVGEDKALYLELLDTAGNPVDMSGWAVDFVVSAKDNTPIANAIFNEHATLIGTFNAARAVNTQRMKVPLTDVQLNTVTNKNYRHSWKRMDDGSETVLSRGDFTPEKATAP